MFMNDKLKMMWKEATFVSFFIFLKYDPSIETGICDILDAKQE